MNWWAQTDAVHIGFTGTREGMTDPQLRTVRWLIDCVRREVINPPGRGPYCADVIAHSGDCVGADAEFNLEAFNAGCYTFGHPPIDRSKRAWCRYDREVAPLEYHARNRAIVNASERMIAAPFEPFEMPSGGTWGTIRFAIETGVPLAIVLPSGRLSRTWDESPRWRH